MEQPAEDAVDEALQSAFGLWAGCWRWSSGEARSAAATSGAGAALHNRWIGALALRFSTVDPLLEVAEPIERSAPGIFHAAAEQTGAEDA